jgi:hypothetical protein
VGVITYLASYYWENHLGGKGLFNRIGAVFVPVGAGSIAYVGLLLWLRVPQANDIWQLLCQKLKGRSATP